MLFLNLKFQTLFNLNDADGDGICDENESIDVLMKMLLMIQSFC